MTKKRPRDRLPNPELLGRELDDVLTLLLEHRAEIVSGYRYVLDLGLDPRQGSDGASVMAGLSDYVPEVAVGNLSSKYPDGKPRPPAGHKDRESAASIFNRVELVRKTLENVLGDVKRGKERQPDYPRRGAFIGPEELEASVAALKRRDEEMTG